MSIPIGCTGCSALAAKVEDGYLAIMHKHHGQKHVTRIPLHKLLELTDKPSTLLNR